MSNQTINLDPSLSRYIQSVTLRESPEMRDLRKTTSKLDDYMMQIAPEQGQFMAFLVNLMGARNCIEVGTYTGYSALAVALALPEEGRLIACDVSTDFTDVGKPFWQRAGVSDRIDLRIGPALNTLDKLIESGESEQFDFAFIDADKVSYSAYVERCYTLLRPGGVIAIDNVLWGGSVADASVDDETTAALRTLNAALHKDTRFDITMLPIGDGLTLLRKL
ncbi:MAG: class I SAM-dependent methyltransferase [Thiolinea sp.]